MKSVLDIAVGTVFLSIAQVASAQGGNTLGGHGGMWAGGWMSGYGGTWTPVLLVLLAVGLVAWFIKQKGK